MKFPSKKDLDKQKKEYVLLPQDDYLLKVEDIEEKEQENYDRTGMEDIVNITFKIISLKDGGMAKDVEKKDATGRKIFFTARPNSMGFMQDGTPSKTRSFVANITRQDIFEELELGDWQDLKGEMINAEIIQYITKKDEKRNKISRFIPIKVKETSDNNFPTVEDSEEKKTEE